MNSFKVADPSKRDREGRGEREKKLDEVSIPLFIKACRETGSFPDQVLLGGQEMKVFPRGQINSPLSLNDISWTDLLEGTWPRYELRKGRSRDPLIDSALPPPRIIIPLAIIKSGERGGINWANYPPLVGDEREDEEREKKKTFPLIACGYEDETLMTRN